jgi:hypothetical protein
MKVDQAKRLKELEKENARLKKLLKAGFKRLNLNPDDCSASTLYQCYTAQSQQS